MPKNKILSIILTLLLALSLAACGGDDGLTTRISELEAKYAQLQAQLDDLSARLEALESPEQDTAPIEIPASAAMVLTGWQAYGNTLTVTDAYAQVQLPSADVYVKHAELVLSRNGSEIGRQPIALGPGEGTGTQALSITGVQFALPELIQDDQLELRLEVTLSDGQFLSAEGAAWYRDGENLYLVVG